MQGANRYAKAVFNYQKIWLAFFLVGTIGFGAGLLKLRVDNSVEALMQEDSKTLRAFRVFTEHFGSSEMAVISFRDERGVMTPDVLNEINELTTQLQDDAQVRHVDQVISLTNVQLMQGTTDGSLTVVPLLDLSAGMPTDTTVLLAAEERAKLEPYLRRTLISDDGKTTAVIIRATYPEDEKTKTVFRQELTHDVWKVLDQFTEKFKTEVHIGGPPVFLTYFDQYILRDMMIFSPLVFLALIAILLLTFRSLGVVFLPLGMVLIGAIWTVGFMAYMGYPITLATTIIPPLLLVTGIEDSIYVYSFYQQETSSGNDRKLRAFKTSALTAVACFLTSITTAIGFGSLAITDIKAIFQTGVVAGIGTMFVWAMNNILMPILLQYVKPPKALDENSKGDLMDRLLSWLAKQSINRTKTVFAIGVVMFLAFLPGIPMLKVETNFIKYFDKESPIVQAHDFMEENLSGVAPLEIFVDTGRPDGMKDPKVLAEIKELEAAIAEESLIDWTFSSSDFVLMLHSAMTVSEPTGEPAVDPKSAAFPITDENLVAQYFLLYSMAGGDAGMNDFISSDGQYGRISSRLHEASTSEIKRVMEKMETKFAATTSGAKYSFADNSAMMVGMVDSMLQNTINSLILATVVIWILISIYLKNWKIGLIFMVPNVIPIFLVLGMMGYMGVDLNLTTMMIGSIAIGLAVDNTIHIFAHFPSALRTYPTVEEATMHTMQTVGRAAVSSGLALMAGFLILTLSDFYPNFWFGSLSAFTMFVALISDLTISYSIWVFLGRAGYKGPEGALGE